MTFSDYLNKAWNEHGKTPQATADQYQQGIELISSEAEISSMVQLILHVSLEHLNDSDSAQSSFKSIKTLNSYDANGESGASIKRGEAVIACVANQKEDLSEFSKNDQIRVCSLVSSLLLGQGKSEQSRKYFDRALSLSKDDSFEMTKENPAVKSLAITGNNSACTLEEKKDRSEFENDYLELCALVGRKYWEIAGTYINVERAEYRLAKTYLQLQRTDKAFEHAQNCVSVCVENGADNVEKAFAYEVLADVEERRENKSGLDKAREKLAETFSKMTPEDQSWSQSFFKNHLSEKVQ